MFAQREEKKSRARYSSSTMISISIIFFLNSNEKKKKMKNKKNKTSFDWLKCDGVDCILLQNRLACLSQYLSDLMLPQKLHIASPSPKLKMLPITLRRKLVLEVLELYTMGN